MSKKSEKRGLGRGLSALMADLKQEGEEIAARADSIASGPTILPITQVVANPDQPRKTFSSDDLQELKRSILEKGIIQPLIVRPDPNRAGMYQIVAGERRWRASQMAKLDEVPVLIRELDDVEVLEIGIIENIQRADLNPVDEASGYLALIDKFGHTQEKLSEALGKSRSHIANTLRLLNLPEDVLHFLRAGQLSAGHARALVTADNAGLLAREVISKGMSVRETEKLAKRGVVTKSANPAPKAAKDSDTISLESDLSANLGMKVAIDHKASAGNGSITIKYKTLEQLDSLCAILSTPR